MTETIKYGCTSTNAFISIYRGYCTPYIGNKAVGRREVIIAFDKTVSTITLDSKE